MIREIGTFTIKLAAFSLALFLVHYYILVQSFSGTLYFPLWTIYCFHTFLVFSVFTLLRYYANKRPKGTLNLFLGLTVLKMLLAILFLLPLFLKKSHHNQLEVLNFFVPYFLLLIFEIMGVNKFLQKG